MTLFANFLGGLCISYLVQYNLYLKIIREAMQMYLREALVSPTRRMSPDNNDQTLRRSSCVLLVVFAINTKWFHPAIHRSNNPQNDVFVLPIAEWNSVDTPRAIFVLTAFSQRLGPLK